MSQFLHNPARAERTPCPMSGARIQRQVAGAPQSVHHVLRAAGQPLNVQTRQFMEPRFGHDFSRVRVHTDEPAAQSAHSINALAYTVGSHIVFGANQFAPGTREGRKLIAHELAHSVQQSTGPGAAGSDLTISHNAVLEHEAEAAAARVGIGESVSVATGSSTGGLQRQPADGGKSQPGDDCSKWENDPVSFSIHIARYVAKMQIAPNVEVTAKSVACKDGRHCDVTLSNGVVMRVAWDPSTRITLGRWDSNDAVLRSIYTYSCHDGQLILTFKDFKRGVE